MTRKDYAGNNTILLNTAVVSTDHCNTTLKQKYVKKKKVQLQWRVDEPCKSWIWHYVPNRFIFIKDQNKKSL